MAEQSIERIMVIMAHPDDPEFGAGGTIARWAREGKEITYVLVTSGDKGTADPNMTPERLMEIREAEQRAAAQRLGVGQVIFLRYRDSEVEPSLALRRDLTREIRRWRPDAVITMNPATYYVDGRYINHPDHRAVGEAALAAIFPTARDHLNFPEQRAEGLEPHKVREVYMTISPDADTFIDITDTIEDKIAALREHRSQFEAFDQLAARVRERAAETAKRARQLGFDVGEYAEAFKRIDLGG